MITIDQVRAAQRTAPNAPETRDLQRAYDTQGRARVRMVYHKPRNGWVDDIVIDASTGEVLSLSAPGFGPAIYVLGGGGNIDTFTRAAHVGDRLQDLSTLAKEHGLKLAPITEASLAIPQK